MSAGRFLYLNNTAGDGAALIPPPARHAVEIVRQYALDEIDLASYTALILSTHADQRHLFQQRHQLDAYLDGGGAVMFNGHVVHRFLPELSPFQPLAVRGRDSLMIHRAMPHPIFDGIDAQTLSFRKGVAGFYGRGTNPPPQGALVLNTIGPDRLAVDWIATRPSGGRLFVHGGNDVWTFFPVAAPGGLDHVQRFFDWFVESAPCHA